MARPKSKSPKGEGIAPYFRNVFGEHKKLLRTRSNKVVLQMWLNDHPGYKDVPNNVKTGLANVKSAMRSKMHKRRGKRAAAEAATGQPGAKPKTSPYLSTNAADSGLEKLEMLIDECMAMAKGLDSKKLDNVIRALLIARRRVVWKLGEE